MRKTIIIISIAAVAILSLAWLYYGYLYKSVRNISNEEPSVTITANMLMQQYTQNQEKANAAYLNKTIQLTGEITNVADSVLTLNKVVVCSFDTKPTAVAGAKTVTIKGRCIGYDELFNEVKLDQCILKP